MMQTETRPLFFISNSKHPPAEVLATSPRTIAKAQRNEAFRQLLRLLAAADRLSNYQRAQSTFAEINAILATCSRAQITWLHFIASFYFASTFVADRERRIYLR